jgi:hypothetical protein
MAIAFVLYHKTTEEILGLYKQAKDTDIDLYPQDPANEDYIEIPIDHAIFGEQFKWRIRLGLLEKKAEVVMIPDKASIAGDGIEECTISFVGLIDLAIVEIENLESQVIDPADPNLILTSDIPFQFRLRVHDDNHWSDEILVVAT